MNKEKALKNQGLEFREDIIIKGGVHDFRGCQIFSLFCRLILQTSVRGDILFRIVATRKNSICFRQQEGFRLRIE